MPVKLSNGTEIEERQMENGAIEAIVLPDNRATTDAEWTEYVAYIRSLNLQQQRERRERARLAYLAHKRMNDTNCLCGAPMLNGVCSVQRKEGKS